MTEPSRWSIIAHARSAAALALLVVAVAAAFVLGRQAVTFIGAPAANAAKVAPAAGSSSNKAAGADRNDVARANEHATPDDSRGGFVPTPAGKSDQIARPAARDAGAGSGPAGAVAVPNGSAVTYRITNPGWPPRRLRAIDPPRSSTTPLLITFCYRYKQKLVLDTMGSGVP